MTKDEKVMFPLMCKNTDKLNKIKELFFKEYPEYSEKNGNFYCHNNILTIDKSLQECNIKTNDIIIFDYHSAYYYPDMKIDKTENQQSSDKIAERFRKKFNVSEKEINQDVLVDALYENNNDIYQIFNEIYGK